MQLTGVHSLYGTLAKNIQSHRKIRDYNYIFKFRSALQQKSLTYEIGLGLKQSIQKVITRIPKLNGTF